jgi:hypothetical protein
MVLVGSVDGQTTNEQTGQFGTILQPGEMCLFVTGRLQNVSRVTVAKVGHLGCLDLRE